MDPVRCTVRTCRHERDPSVRSVGVALSAIAITTLAKATAWLGIDPSDFTRPALSVYHDGSTGGATTCTVEVTATQLILNSDIGGQDTTITLSDAANDTLTELTSATIIDPADGYVVELLYHGDAAATDLQVAASADCFGIAVKQTLDIADNRGLELIIEGVTAEIEKYLGRGILTRAYTELVWLEEGCICSAIPLAQPDMTAVQAVRLATLHAMTVQYTGANPRATVEVTDTAVVTRNGSTTTTSTFAANATLAAMETAIEAVANWTVTIPASIDSTTPSTYLVRTAGRACKAAAQQLSAWEDYDGDYAFNFAAGVLSVNYGSAFWPYRSSDPIVGQGMMQVAYTAGFATVPYDIEQVALSMIADEFNGRGRDTRLQSESLEGYSYAYQGQAIDAMPEWTRRLARYVRHLP